ncbi:MAG: hypothetical protein R3B48_21875 [Kofleriaceae bacterium]
MTRSLLLPLLLVAGCADNTGDGSLRVIRNQVIEGESCVVSSTLTTTGRSGGAIEVTSPVDYVLTPVVQNFATSSGGKLTAQRTAFLEGARIDLSFAKADLFTDAELAELTTAGLTKFASPFSAAVSPDGGSSGVGFSVVPAELLTRMRAKLATVGSTVVNVRLTVYGSMGGGDVESEPFFYPVTVCDHNVAPCVIGSTFTCGATGVDVRKGNACNPFQDGPVDCCTSAGTLYCPGMAGT